jgi:uncharacterized membrane protein SpoIIM required for sporulation
MEKLTADRRARWARLGELLRRVQAGGGPAALEAEEVREFARLYRETAADLARLRTGGAEAEVEQYVERLVAAGHNALYRAGGEGGGGWRGAVRFLATGFPRLARASGSPLALAAGIWLVGVALAYAAGWLRPDLLREAVPPAYLDRVDAAVAARAAGRPASYLPMDAAFVPLFASALVANNVQATFVVFALGITAGAGTAAALLLNGMLFGAVAALFEREGVPGVFWTFTAAHGPVELPAFFLAGAAGLRLGGALIRPGARTRRDALVFEALEASQLLAGTTALLVAAAVLEGVVSPSALPGSAKAAIGVAAGGAVAWWLLRGGRGTDPGAGRTAVRQAGPG